MLKPMLLLSAAHSHSCFELRAPNGNPNLQLNIRTRPQPAAIAELAQLAQDVSQSDSHVTPLLRGPGIYKMSTIFSKVHNQRDAATGELNSSSAFQKHAKAFMITLFYYQVYSQDQINKFYSCMHQTRNFNFIRQTNPACVQSFFCRHA